MACSLLSRLFHRRSASPSPLDLPRLGSSTATSSLHTVLGVLPDKPLSPLLIPTDLTSHTASESKPQSNDQLLQELPAEDFSSLKISHETWNTWPVSSQIDDTFRGLEGYLNTRTETDYLNGTSDHRICIVDFRTCSAASNAQILHPQVIIHEQVYAVNPLLEYNMNNTPKAGLPDVVGQNDREQGSSIQPPPTTSPPSEVPRPRKRLRKQPPKPALPRCSVCFTDIEGLFSTPCLSCHSPRCYDCLKKQFQVAMTDFERMPVQCCGRIMHYEVVHEILPAAEIEAYKLRFDQANTPNPLYCPVPTCSTFIPPRLVSEGATTVSCSTCLATVCTKCKELAGDNHLCGKNQQRDTILDTYHYKACPKCGTGVMRMFGCSHIRCFCGAHWCWDCQRPINACGVDPCHEAREDGASSEFQLDDSDSDDDSPVLLPETLDDTTQPTSTERPNDTPVERSASLTESLSVTEASAGPVATPLFAASLEGELMASATDHDVTNIEPPGTNQSTTQEPIPQQQSTEEDTMPTLLVENEQVEVATSADAAPPTIEIENLDDPGLEWEAGSIWFGDEPADEYADIWGCQHHLQPFAKQHVPKFWKVGADPKTPGDLEVECMSCFKQARVWENKEDYQPSSSKGRGLEKKKSNEKPVPSKDSLLEKKPCTDSHAFWCDGCYMIYCGVCKKAVMREVRRKRKGRS